jgi:DNA invertase Pin-like site-specific DNA recombinase
VVNRQRSDHRVSRTSAKDRAIGIVRCSTSKQDIGAAAQRAELQRWAADNGIELVAVFEDLGVSGAAPLAERPGLLDAIVAMQRHGARRLVAVKRDRFARHRHTMADIERAVAAAGGVLVTTDGTCLGDDTEAEELRVGFMDLLAALELRKIRARNKARCEACRAAGRTHGGRLPFGYRRRAGGRTGRSGAVVELEPDPTEQAVLRRIVDLADAGRSLRQVAGILANDGITARNGRPWQPSVLARIVSRARAGQGDG